MHYFSNIYIYISIPIPISISIPIGHSKIFQRKDIALVYICVT